MFLALDYITLHIHDYNSLHHLVEWPLLELYSYMCSLGKFGGMPLQILKVYIPTEINFLTLTALLEQLTILLEYLEL